MMPILILVVIMLSGLDGLKGKSGGADDAGVLAELSLRDFNPILGELRRE